MSAVSVEISSDSFERLTGKFWPIQKMIRANITCSKKNEERIDCVNSMHNR
ncbi:MAG: hypothetical protein ACHBN1_09675 [Heteroscytonema crispum UTEX LB 1556]